MKKPTRTLLTKKLDKEFGRIVRSVGVCARCGKGAEEVTLHCAHIFSRRNMSVRWNLLNAICLCYSCHYWWCHPNPILFQEFVKEYLGEHNYKLLKLRALEIKQWDLWELEELLKTLQEVK